MKKDNGFRPLLKAEIESLLNNRCRCSDWNDVEVKDGFNPSFYNNVSFSGKVKLGVINRLTPSGNVPVPSQGIENVNLHNCIIGDDVSIINTGDCISGYIIDDNVIIKNCGRISTEGETAFGNGTEVAVLNENGKRKIRIWDRLSSHQAYIMTMYKHKSNALKKLDKIIGDYARSVSSPAGRIGKGSVITNTTIIKNVRFGPFSRVDGALKLTEGSVNSNENDPVVIGSGVIMEHFIISSGSEVTNSAIIEKCFIGQGCLLGNQFTAENSLFFANCECTRSEACSVFAGPFTVTHHKATLLLASVYSFMNAGSGTNHSNHMYKLGPVHQGIIERGSKTTSGSYIMWPARIGAFTLIMGRHYKNFDISSLPFSYLIEKDNDGLLFPAINIKSVGTYRDELKWQQRDKRKDRDILDKIIVEVMNPYTAGRMEEGIDILMRIKGSAVNDSDSFIYSDLTIKGSALEKGIVLYRVGLERYVGSLIIARLDDKDFQSEEDLRALMRAEGVTGTGRWIDTGGLIVPQEEVENLIADVEKDNIIAAIQLDKAFDLMYRSYKIWEWNWAVGYLEKECGKGIADFSAGDIQRYIERWKISSSELDRMIIEDSGKEFSPGAMTGYGVDGGEEEKKLDFSEVRGDSDTNPVIMSVKERAVSAMAVADRLIENLLRVRQD